MTRETGDGTRAESPHAPALARLGVLEPACGRLCRYLDTLAAWSPRVNLTGVRTPDERVELLVGSVLGALGLPAPGRLIDVGSGNGSPGLVFALLREDLRVVLLEPRQKRWAFLREAARAAGVAGSVGRVEVVRCRHDGYTGPPGDTVTLRALSIRLAEMDRLVTPRGEILVIGGEPKAEPPFVEAHRVPAVPGGAWLFRRAGVPRGTPA